VLLLSVDGKAEGDKRSQRLLALCAKSVQSIDLAHERAHQFAFRFETSARETDPDGEACGFVRYWGQGDSEATRPERELLAVVRDLVLPDCFEFVVEASGIGQRERGAGRKPISIQVVRPLASVTTGQQDFAQCECVGGAAEAAAQARQLAHATPTVYV